MIIMKFGGSSLAKPETIKRVVAIVATAMEAGESGVVVCSAFGGVTDQLLECGRRAAEGDSGVNELLNDMKRRHLDAVDKLVAPTQKIEVTSGVNALFHDLSDILKGVALLRELSARANDAISSFGERLSAFIISYAIQTRIPQCDFLDTRALIKTDDQFGNARVDWEQTKNAIQNHFKDQSRVHVATGFIASTSEGRTTTLGRGGFRLYGGPFWSRPEQPGNPDLDRRGRRIDGGSQKGSQCFPSGCHQLRRSHGIVSFRG